MKNLLLISFSLFFFVNISVYGDDRPHTPNEIDDENYTYCDDREGSKAGKYGHTVVLIDLTSELNPPQIKFIKDQVFSEEFYLGKTPFTKFSYLLINNKSVQMNEYIFSKCRPKTGGSSKLEKANWDENKIFVESYYEEFIDLTQVAHKNIFKNKISSDTTLIIETISSLWKNPVRLFGENVGKRNLIIVSDMLQNSERLNFYRVCNATTTEAKCPSFKSFMQNLSDKDHLNATAPKGDGVGLKIIYLNNRNETKKELDRTLIKLWENYFKDRGFENIKTVRQLDLK